MDDSEQRRALDGVRVLDLTHQVAGPSATLMLAFLGAEVVKVIAPGSRDSYDAVPFYLNNASKKSVELDLKSDAGRETALRLADRADIFVENFSPGVIDRLGLGWDVLSARNPRLIYAQVKGFAEDSPYRDYPCFDPIAQGFAGASSITGEPDDLPMKPGPDVGDTGTGMVLVGAILAALYQREKDGLGQRLQIAMTDQVATFMRIHYRLADRALDGHAAVRQPAAVPVPDRAVRHLSLPAVRAERLRAHPLRQRPAVGADGQADGPRGPARRPAVRHHDRAGASTRTAVDDGGPRLDVRARQDGRDARARRGRGAGGRAALDDRGPRRRRPARARHLRHRGRPGHAAR